MSDYEHRGCSLDDADWDKVCEALIADISDHRTNGLEISIPDFGIEASAAELDFAFQLDTDGLNWTGDAKKHWRLADLIAEAVTSETYPVEILKNALRALENTKMRVEGLIAWNTKAAALGGDEITALDFRR